MPCLRHKHTIKSFASMALVSLAALPSFGSLLAEKVNTLVTPTTVIVNDVTVQDSVTRWKPISLNFEINPGETICENSAVNPFYDYRVDVFFRRPGGVAYDKAVPGYYAADGNAADSRAFCGNVWRVTFVPDEVGRWEYSAVISKGAGIAVSEAQASDPVVREGSFDVSPIVAHEGDDFYRRGMLRHPDGSRYYRFDNGEYFLKSGPNSPETFLGYTGFDDTPWARAGNSDVNIDFDAHVADYAGLAPLWSDGKGAGIFGAIDFLAAEKMNVVYMLAFNAGGDAQNVWPYNDKNFFENINTFSRYQDFSQSLDKFKRFDVSKLDQWNRVFTHMMHQGVAINFVLSEEENQVLLGGGGTNSFTNERKLFYRELIARFSHHNALFWNIGEENGQTNPDWKTQSSRDGWYALHGEREQWIDYLYNLDPYQHPIVLHTIPPDEGFDPPAEVYEDLLGNSNFSGPSMQLQERDNRNIYNWTGRWVTESAGAGHQWVVNLDEYLNYNKGIYDNHDVIRKEVLWPHFMAGGAGVEWYYGQGADGYNYDQQDINWRGHEGDNEFFNIWRDSRNALHLFRDFGIPFWDMTSDYGNTVTPDARDFVLSTPDESFFVIYRTEEDISSSINLPEKEYFAHWYNPVSGVFVATAIPFYGGFGSPYPVGGFIGENDDWVVVISDTPDFSQKDSYEFNFDSTDQGWSFVVPLGLEPARGSYDAGSLNVYPDSLGGMGFWDSPVLSLDRFTGTPLEVGERLYKARYFVRSDKRLDPGTAPTLRFRTAEEDFSVSAVTGIEPIDYGAALPNSNGEWFEHYFVLPHEEALRVSFDVLSFSDTDSMISKVSLDEVDITVEKELSSSPSLLTRYDLRTSDADAWSYVDSEYFSSPPSEKTEDGLSIFYDTNASSHLVGFWEYLSSVAIEAGEIYRIDYTVASNIPGNAKDQIPAFRLRMNSEFFHYYSLLNVDPRDASSLAPVAGSPAVYSLYFIAPEEVDGQRMLLSFDMVESSGVQMSSLPITLQQVSVYRY